MLLCFLSLEAAHADVDKEAFDRFISHYYEHPEPKRAPEMLQFFLVGVLGNDSRLQQDRHTQEIMAYLFGRIAQNHPDVVRQYEELIPKTAGASRRVLVSALIVGAHDEAKTRFDEWMVGLDAAADSAIREEMSRRLGKPTPNPLDHPATSALDLDLLWADFFVSGSQAPVARLVDVLDRPDRLRQRLSNWLATHEDPKNRKVVVECLDRFGISYDQATGQIAPDVDLDIHCAFQLRGSTVSQEFVKLRQLIAFDQSDVEGMAVKGAAAWALGSNCRQGHGRLVQYLESEISCRPAKCQFLLRQMVKNRVGKGTPPSLREAHF